VDFVATLLRLGGNMRLRLGLSCLIVIALGWVLYSLNAARLEREAFAVDINSKMESQVVATGLWGKTLALQTPDGWNDPVSCSGWVSEILHEKEQEPVRAVLRRHGFTEISCLNVKGAL
jgi:hypothetical protein